jgi:hypothetical protein
MAGNKDWPAKFSKILPHQISTIPVKWLMKKKKRGNPFAALCNVISTSKKYGYKLAMSSNF